MTGSSTAPTAYVPVYDMLFVASEASTLTQLIVVLPDAPPVPSMPHASSPLVRASVCVVSLNMPVVLAVIVTTWFPLAAVSLKVNDRFPFAVLV